jgi:hypothetical protein
MISFKSYCDVMFTDRMIDFQILLVVFLLVMLLLSGV